MPLNKIIYFLILLIFINNQLLAQSTTEAVQPNVSNPSIISGKSTSNTDNRIYNSPRYFSRTPANYTTNLQLQSARSLVKAKDNETDEKIYYTGEFSGEKKFALDFFALVENTIGEKLPIFGETFFNFQSNPRFDPLTVPHDYQVGPGDELIIQAWGQINIDYQGVIERSGVLFIPQIGAISLAGQKIKDLQPLLKSYIAKQYKNFELTVTLGKLRQIQFYLSGYAKNPGVHASESTATALYALMSTGGALATGDLRNIQLLRNGRLVHTFDAYNFLNFGDKSTDPQLQPGDVLHIPPAYGLAAIAGNVKRSAIYHLNDKMTIGDLLQLAGGGQIKQDNYTMRLERITNNKRIVEHLSGDKFSLQKKLQDGDILIVLPLNNRFEKTITLRGNVAIPLRQKWQSGMKVADLLNPQDGLIRPAAWLRRSSINNLNQLGKEISDNNFQLDFPEVNWNYAAIERLNDQNYSLEIIPFNLQKALAKDSEHNLELQSGDSIIIFSRNDFLQPQSSKLKIVKIEGEINSPGYYQINDNDNLVSLVTRAGGLTRHAYLFGSVFIRESAKKNEAKLINEIANKLEEDYLRLIATKSKDGGNSENSSNAAAENEAIKQLIASFRKTEAVGRIIMRLNNNIKQLTEFPDFSFEDQDMIRIPARPTTVAIFGAVRKSGSQIWQENLTVADYIENAGGLHKYADSSNVTLLRADGSSQEISGFFAHKFTKLMPGDNILVNEDIKSSSFTRSLRDWSQILYQIGLGAAGFKYLGLP